MNTRNHTAGSATKWVLAAALTLVFGLVVAAAPARAETLNMLSVGVSKFKDNYVPNLGSPHKDAISMAQAFQGQRGKLFTQVAVSQLLNEQATAGNIIKGLQGMRAKASANSYTVFFVASHGGTSNGKYAFCAHDQQVQWSSVQSALSGLPGKIIVILDTCGSGGVTYGGNMIVFSACLSFQTSGEDSAHGFFTKAFLAGLGGKADLNRDGKITLAEVDAYVSNQLDIYNKGKKAKECQQCSLLRPANVASSLPMALVGATSTPVVTNPTTPVVTPNPTTGGLAGTTWQGQETLSGFGNLKFVFQGGGQVTMYDVQKNYPGTWTQQGNRVTINLPSVQLTYTGTVNGTTIAGQGSDPKGKWTFNVSKSK